MFLKQLQGIVVSATYRSMLLQISDPFGTQHLLLSDGVDVEGQK